MLAGIRELMAASVGVLRAQAWTSRAAGLAAPTPASRICLGAAVVLSPLLSASAVQVASPVSLSTSTLSCSQDGRGQRSTCEMARLPRHAYLDADASEWECDRGFRQTDRGCAFIDVPPHAHLTDYAFGKGWECEVGYQDTGRSCQPVHVPPNAYPSYDPFGPGWVCKRGYAPQGDTCTAIKIPAHAYLVAAGDRWQCDRGFYDKNELACATLLLPKNAHLGDTGHDWECDRGFRKQGYGCTAVQAPSHAYATYELYGRGWRCERGYEAYGTSCIAIRVPENAYLRASGDQWECERGFAQTGDACIPIRVPPHAHVDILGNSWECNTGYQARQDRCVAGGA